VIASTSFLLCLFFLIKKDIEDSRTLKTILTCELNKKIKAAYDFGNDYGSFRYALGNIWTYKIALLFY